MKALITGASSGIGKSMCYYLASKNIDLILVARSKDELEKIKSEVSVNTEIINMDLQVQDNFFSSRTVRYI